MARKSSREKEMEVFKPEPLSLGVAACAPTAAPAVPSTPPALAAVAAPAAMASSTEKEMEVFSKGMAVEEGGIAAITVEAALLFMVG